MFLYVHSDAAYIVACKAKSRIADFCDCCHQEAMPTPSLPLNGLVHIERKLHQHVVTSAAEVETDGGVIQ